MCGITALLSLDKQDIFYELYESLYHLQHRGQDSFGFSFLKDDKIQQIKEKCMLSNSTKTTNIQKIAKVPTDSHDIKMDVIVTDKFIYRKKD